jgi:hypothetical protein
MQDQATPGEGDFVRVASCATPTEAHLLKNVLEASGVRAAVTDANIVQAEMLMAQAFGGVRVLVPASQAEAARQAIAEFHAGDFELDDGEAQAPAAVKRPLSAPVFSPDRATVWSFALTPVFGATLQLANSLAAGGRAAQWRDAAWLAVMAALTAAAVVVAHHLNPGLFVVFRAGLATSMLTVIWYFLAMQERSKELLEAHGHAYARRPMLIPALGAIGVALLIGWGLGE